MKILYATSELAPWVKTGGLADVSEALPAALHGLGADIRILVPSYPAFKAAYPDAPMVAAIPALSGQLHGAAIRAARGRHGVPLYLLECDAYFDRPGNPYLGPEGHDWLDNGFRFGLLSRVAALLSGADSPLDWRPDILHCSDWQTGLAPAYLRYRPAHGPQARSVMTLHNLAFQGIFSRDMLHALGLPDHAWAMDGVEYHGYLSFLKAGLQHADAITTVSPTYAREIQTEAEGMGLDGLLRHRAPQLHGILNGIDTETWNPAADPLLHARYEARKLDAKAANTEALRRETGLAPLADRALIGSVGRLAHQKGIDLLPGAIDALADSGGRLPAQFVILGSGDSRIEAQLRDLAARFAGQVVLRSRFDEGLAHRIEAGADYFLMPSRFEPCGLNQMYSLRYGTPPIVRATGGLADTVTDADAGRHGTGIVFQEATVEALAGALRRAIALWQDRRRYRALQRAGMTGDYGWKHPAAAYQAIYAGLVSGQAAGAGTA